MLFIRHKSEWVKPGDWPRLKQELADQPKLYEYAMQVHNNMAWMEDASAILGDTKPWFIHPAGMMGLVGDSNNKESSLKIDYDFIHTLEGGMILNGYVPEPEKSKSGVTISVGFDLGARNLSDLNRLNLKPSLISKLTPYLRMQKLEADRFVKANPLVITSDEAKEIYLAVKKQSTEELIRKYNAESEVESESLPKEAQTVIASVEYQYGSLKISTPAFWEQVVHQEWQDAYDNLLDFGDAYISRRRKEAKYLEAIL
jgi:hypothetical protein